MNKENKKELIDEVTNYTLNLLIENLISIISQTDIKEFYISKDEIKFKLYEGEEPEEYLNELTKIAAQSISLYLYQNNINDPIVLYKEA